MRTLTTPIVVLAALALQACQIEGPGTEPLELRSLSPMARARAVEPVAPVQQGAVSECGGFARPAVNEYDGPDSYCDAELLRWAYDAEAATLELVDTRAVLNCCGERSIAAEVVDGVYIVTEIDSAEGAGRCDCICTFDLSLTLEAIEVGVVSVRLQRQVTDEESSASTLWEGTIDLAAGEGTIVLDETPAPFCRPEPEPELSVAYEVSGCGGFGAAWGPADEGYCDTELLSWGYDAGTQTLALQDSRVPLNCCGERFADLAVVDGVYVMTETDMPTEESGRCWCMCVFDFAIEAQGIAQAPIAFRLVRDVTDDEAGPVVVFEGTLDLSAGAGEVVVDDEALGADCG